MQKRARTDDFDFSETSSPKRANSEDPLSDGEQTGGISSNMSLVDPTLLSRGSGLALRDFEEDEEDSKRTMSAPSSTVASGSGPSRDELAPAELSPEEKLQMITNFKKQPLNKGDTWFLIDRRWFRRFSTAFSSSQITEEEIESLKPIDNSRILDENNKLKPDLVEGMDVEMVPSTAWDALETWFGCDVSIPRRVIEGQGLGNERLEFYPPTVTVLFVSSPTIPPPSSPPFAHLRTPFEKPFSAAVKFKIFSSLVARSHFKLVPKDCRYWKLSADVQIENGKGAFITPDEVQQLEPVLIEDGGAESETLESLNIKDGSILALEWKNPEIPGASWPLSSLVGQSEGALDVGISDQQQQQPSQVTGSPAASQGLFSTPGYVAQLENVNSIPPLVKEPKGLLGSLTGILTRSKTALGNGSNERSRKGVMGLSNLGNTCFMNSAIQCMANTNELNRYFLSEVYKDEINRSNPLGMKGQVASSFGDLVSHLYHGTSSSFSPGEFKRTLARFAPSFSGYQQHDSQEFITFLLDGLHEDLNRIMKKPYVESPDWMGGGEEELARLAMACWEGYKKRNDSVIVDLFQGQYKSTVKCPQCDKVSVTFDPFMYLTLPLPVKKKFETRVYYIPQDPLAARYQVDISVPKDSSFKHVKDLLAKWFNVDAKRLITTELWKGQIYKFWSDHEAISEVALSDVIVFYEVGTNLRSRHEPEAYGAPFFITVTSEQSKDAKLITELIIEQYQRILPHTDATNFWKTEAVSLTSEHVDVAETPASSAEQVEEQITEIRVDEDGEVEQKDASVPSPLTVPGTPMDVTSPLSPAESVKASYVASETVSPATTTPAPQKSKPTPIFNVQVFSNRWVPSDSRVIPDGKQMYNLRDFDLTTSSESSDDTNSIGPTQPTSTEAQPLVYPGQGLICIWPSMDTVHQVFGSDESTNAFASTYETFTDPSAVPADPTTRGKKKAVLTIDDCLDEFSKEETLGEDDLWYCSNCKAHQPATKKLELWKVPDILVVHLKRFGGARNLRDKIDNLIEFPITDFDLENRVQERSTAKVLASSGVDLESLGLETTEEPLLYDLYGVDQHYGGLGGGHYTAVAKNVEDGTWYSFDDSRVSSITESSVVTPAAYVLFYRRRTTRPIGGNSRVKAEKALQEKAIASLNASAANSTLNSAVPSIYGGSGRTSPSGDWYPGLRSSGLDNMDSMPGGFPGSSSAPSSPISPNSINADLGDDEDMFDRSSVSSRQVDYSNTYNSEGQLLSYDSEDAKNWRFNSIDRSTDSPPGWVADQELERQADLDEFLASGTNPSAALAAPQSAAFNAHPSPPTSDDEASVPVSAARPPVDEDYDQLASENNSEGVSASSSTSAMSKENWVVVEDEAKP
ncbi:Ubiquitin C-terminal hydrolase [Phaffia rhodozyma]|uniref:ubiquitinyl hydrolase 1 n=1 Tax=Phaffia rhodozyma TaxID=264483 RepID=A0A0F7SQW2_PHARH|nr:Ubiquitin C-terminal hydrolase [Phaffia rhodozyma]